MLVYSKSKNIHTYILKTSEYPYFDFEISKKYIKDSYLNLDQHLSVGNKVNIGIDTFAYRSKILKNREPNFWTKHFGYKKIQVYELTRLRTKFLINEDGAKKKKSFVYFWLVLALITGGIIILKFAISYTLK